MRMSPGAVWLLRNTAATRMHCVSCTRPRIWLTAAAPACWSGAAAAAPAAAAAAAAAASAAPDPLAAVQKGAHVPSVGLLQGPSSRCSLSSTVYSSVLVHCLCSLPFAATSRAAGAAPCMLPSLGLHCCSAHPATRYSRGLATVTPSRNSRSSNRTTCNNTGCEKPREEHLPQSGGQTSACITRLGSSSSSTMRRGSSNSDNQGNSVPLFVAEAPQFNGEADAPKSLWRLLASALWPASRCLKARVVGAVASLLVAKCLTIAAPVALASLVDHFTQTAAAEATQAAAGAAAAAPAAVADAAVGTTGTTFPGVWLHPALPVGLVMSYPLARLGASGREAT